MVLFEAILVLLTWYKTITNLGSQISLARTPIMALLRKDGECLIELPILHGPDYLPQVHYILCGLVLPSQQLALIES